MTLTWKFRGFDYTSYYNGAYTNADSLTGLAATGANAVETTLDWGINTLTNVVYRDSSYTDPLTAEASVIREAVAKGLQVVVKPHIDFLTNSDHPNYLTGEWRAYYNPGAANSAGANSFFASYKSMLLQEASVAAANGATVLSIGTELDQIAGPAYKSYWDDIISAVRAQDPGLKLTYAAIWDDSASPWGGEHGLSPGTGNIATQISFASELDYLGLDVYAPLSNATNPTLQQLVDGWTQAPVDSGATAATYSVTGGQSLVHYFESIATAVGKPLLFTEVGFENATDAASSPAYTQTNVEDDALQLKLYQSLFQAYAQSGDTAVTGAFLYNWDPNAAEVGPGSIAFSPQNLPALSAVEGAFAAPALPSTFTIASQLNTEVGVSGLSVSTNSTGSVFTVTLTDAKGLLSASGGAGAQIGGSGSANLSIVGTLNAVNSALATLQYEATTAANDTIQVSVSADGGPTGTGSVSVNYDANPPVLNFSTVSLVSGTTVNISGTVSPANVSRPVTYFVNGVMTATTPAQAGGAFASNLTLPPNGIAVVKVALTDALGATGVSSPLMIGVGDALTATFSAQHGNVVDLFSAASTGDTVVGSNGYVIDYGSKVTIEGGDDQIYTDSLAADIVTLIGTGGQADNINGSNTTVALDGAQANVIGAGDHVNFAGGTGNSATLSETGGLWDTVATAGGVTGTVNLAGSALATITGSGAAANFTGGSGNAVSLVNTGSAWDSVAGANGLTYLANALAQVTGANETVYFWGGSGDAVSLVNSANTWDSVAGANGATGTTYLTNALAQVTGANETAYFWGGSGNAVSLVGTANTWDSVAGANGATGTTYLTNALAQVTGADEKVYFWGGSGDAVSLVNTANTWDDVSDANGAVGTVYLSNAYARVTGGGDRLTFWSGAGNGASLINTGATADVVSSVNGASGEIYLSNASASVSGGSETVAFWSGASNAVTLSGNNYTALFQQPSFGLDSISGYNASDVLSFNIANQGHLGWTQSGGNTTITLDGTDAVTLNNYVGSFSLNYHS